MNINRITIVLSLVLLGLLPGLASAQAWYGTPGWAYRKAITIDYTKVGTGPHTNFPVLISRADTDLQARALSTGNDILFTSSDGTTKLAHEIESYTSGSGTLVAWVQIPSLSSSVNTVIYMYYGNAGAANQQNVTGTWNTNYKGVWHLNGVFTDSTSNAAHGTNTGTLSATGMISGGRSFVRSDGTDFITITGLMGSPANATLSAWASLTTRDPSGAELISLGDYLGLDVDQTTLGGLGYAYFGGFTWTGTPSNVHYAGTGWHYMSYTFDDVGNVQRFFVDGVEVGTTTIAGSITWTGLGTNTVIGKHANANTNYDFDGTADEVRISNVVRSGGWVLTEFNNQNSPATFYSVGSEFGTKTFTGTGNFSDAARWSGGTVPIGGENLIINGACTVDNNAGTDNVAYGTLVIGTATGRTLNWAASGTNRLNVTNVSAGAGASTLSMTNGGTLSIGGTWTSTNLTFTSGTGTIEIRSTLTLPAAYATYNNVTVNGSGTTVTQDVGTTVNGNLTVTSGTFTVGAFSLVVTGTATVTSALTITSATGAKSFGALTINGGTFTNTAANAPITIATNLQNNGTFSQGTGRVTFTGATSNTISGAAATTAFGGGITVDKGVSNANVLDAQSVITMLAGGLTLTNGTFKLSSASTITPFTADITASPYLIPSTAGLWCNGGTMNSPGGGMAWTVQGLIRVSAGTINVGAVTGNFLAPFTGTSIIIDGGNLVLADRMSLLASVWTFSMTSGTLTVANAGSNTADRPPFNMDQAGCSFSMSGGTIIIARPGGSAGQNLGYRNLATSGTGFTGGTLQIGNGSTPAASTIGITSTNAIYNLTVNATSSTAQLQTSALTVTNTVTISAGTLSANNLNLTVGGDWINNVSTAAFTAGTAIVTFNGAVAGGSVGGSFATTFNSLTMNRTNGISLGANATAGGTLTFTIGNITTGSNNLYLGSTGTVSRTSGHVIGNFRKNVATGATSRTFEIGGATNYTPVTVAFASVTTAGDLTASTASGDHANIATSTINASKSVNRKWTLTNSGIVFATYDATFMFVAGDVDGGASTAAFIVGKYSAGWTYPTVGTKTATTTEATGLTSFSDFQVGEALNAVKTWDGGAGTSNWGDAANWNTDGVPTSSNDVNLTGANTININVGAAANNLLLNNAGLTLTVNSGNSLTVAGNLTLTSGTLNTAAGFPTVTGTVNVASGTVGFTGSGSQTIPAYSYNNLTSSSTGARTLASSGTIGIAGTFTPGTNTYAITGSTVNYNSSAAQAIAALNYNNLTLSNAGVKTFSAGTTGVAAALSITGTASANATTNSSVISYNGSTNQTITALTYHGLNVSSTGGVVTGINTTVTNFSINSGTLDLNTFTLTITGTATYTAGTINNGTVTSTGATTTFAGTVFGAIVNATSDALYLSGSTFNNTATLTKNGATPVLGTGGNTFNSTATIVHSGSAYLVLGNTVADVFNGDVVFTNSGSNVIYAAFNSPGNQFNGNVTFNNIGTGSWIQNSFGSAATAAYNGNIIVNNTSTLGIYFGGLGGLSTLAATKTISIGGTGFATGTLYLSYFTQNGTTPQALTLTGTALLQIGPTATFNGNVSFISPQILLYGATYNGTVYIQKTGATQNNSLGGNVFNSTTTIVNSSSAHLVLGFPTGVDIFNGDVTFSNTGTAGIYPAYNTAGHQFNGNIILNVTNNGTIFFCGGTGTATLATGKALSVGAPGFSSGGLYLLKLTQLGTTAQTLSLTGTAFLWLGAGSTFNGNVNFTAPQLYLGGSTYNGTATLTKNGVGDNASDGGNTFNSSTSITNSGTGFLRLANTTADDFNGDATFIQTGSGLLQPAYASNSTFAGNLSTAGTATAIILGSGAGTATLDGAGAQSIAGAFPTTFNNLTVNNPSGITLATNVTVNSVITFTTGTVTTGSNNLYIAPVGSVSRTSGHVVGNFKKNIATGATGKTFEIGDGANYTPVTVAFASVTTAGDLTARTASGDHANIASSTLNPAKTVNRNWTLTNGGIAFTTYDATFTFVAGDVDAGANTANFIVGKYNAGWTYPTVGTKTATTTQIMGLTTFSDFQLGQVFAPPAVTLVNSVTPSGTQSPGTDLLYTVDFMSSGGQAAKILVVVDPIPANTDFKLGSAGTVLGTTGMTVANTYSNDNGVTYAYTPVSAGGGAPAGYDRGVTHIKWTFTGNLSQTSPNNSGSVSFTAQIR